MLRRKITTPIIDGIAANNEKGDKIAISLINKSEIKDCDGTNKFLIKKHSLLVIIAPIKQA